MNFLTPAKRTTQTVPIIPIRDVVVFPSSEIVLTFGRKKSILAINEAVRTRRNVALFAQKDSEVADPKTSDLYKVGTICTVERTLKEGDELNVLVRGVGRVGLLKVASEEPFPEAEVIELQDFVEKSDEFEALARHLTKEFKNAVNLGKPVEFMNFMKLMSGVAAGELADQVATTLSISTKEKQKLLENLDVKLRLNQVIDYLTRELKVLEIEKKIASKTQAKFSKSMKEAVLRERIATIKQELGEESEEEMEFKELESALSKLDLGKANKKKVVKELHRLEQMSPHSPEYSYVRTWLDTVLELPWGSYTADRVSLKSAEAVLNEDHYGLEEVKERILEYLSVMKLKKKKEKGRGISLPTILCFVGPPGVGKTSIGRSIAKSLKRKFVKVSLGGIRDEAEIRGHRKTYVGAMPGRIIDGIRQSGSSNPVFMLDEIDKIGNDFRGDPSAALLEALDPEQNSSFSDHYLELEYDLSRVMFIATANVLDTIPAALRDRLEVIRFSGYTETEKYHIASDHLLPKVIVKNALGKTDLKLNKSVMLKIIRAYTREAGVRSLERELSKIARKLARTLASGKKNHKNITPSSLSDYLGPEKILPTLAEKTHPIGQATGLAWTVSGGDILFIEVAVMPGSGKIQLTGQLGDVMKESAQAAYTYVRSHYQELGLKSDFYKKIDLHVHVPEGAVPKDGPSAGVTLATAIVSALTKKKVNKTIGMTGEVTLRGRVLEIGGLKEKMIAGQAAGLKEIIFPAGNTKDLVKIPDEIKRELKLLPVKDVREVLAHVFV